MHAPRRHHAAQLTSAANVIGNECSRAISSFFMTTYSYIPREEQESHADQPKRGGEEANDNSRKEMLRAKEQFGPYSRCVSRAGFCVLEFTADLGDVIASKLTTHSRLVSPIAQEHVLGIWWTLW